MRPPRPKTTYEYSSLYFDKPLSKQLAIRLNDLAENLKKSTKSTVIEAIRNRANKTVGIRAYQFVGVIRIDKNLIIEILPKMYRDSQDDSGVNDQTISQKSKDINIDNLFFMLNYCGQMSIPHSYSSSLQVKRGSFFESLIYIFARGLLDELLRDAYHEYIVEESNLPFIRGKLLISQNIRINMTNQSKFYTASDSFTPNNQLNQILKYATRLLLNVSSDTTNHHILRRILAIYDPVSDVRITRHNLENITLNRQNQRFSQSLDLAKMFLANKTIQLRASDFESLTFMIDMNKLFEDFIATAMRKALHKNGSNLTVKTQGPVRAFVSGSSESPSSLFSLRPDITLLNENNKPEVVFDSKYKLLNDKAKHNISQADIYQMFAYSHRYGTKNVTLIYPETFEHGKQDGNYYIDSTATIHFHTVNLKHKLSLDKASSIEKGLHKICENTSRFIYQNR